MPPSVQVMRAAPAAPEDWRTWRYGGLSEMARRAVQQDRPDAAAHRGQHTAAVDRQRVAALAAERDSGGRREEEEEQAEEEARSEKTERARGH